MKARHIVLLVLAAAALAALLVWSGLFNVAASTGHWAITDWLLHYAMRQSVETHSMGIEAPPLEDEALVRRGAGHYETACRQCHGAPGVARPPTTLQMTPPPPDLTPKIAEWDPRELFWIVKHGVKFTGMPAWPAQTRDDEVWAMVAFLLRLPALDAEAYRRLAFGELAEAEPRDDALARCIRCHGRDGLGGGTGAFPRLDIQSHEYLRDALAAFARGHRQSGIMEAAVAGLTDEALDALARRYGRSSDTVVETPAQPFDEALVSRGRELARHGDRAAKIPACDACHAVSGREHKPDYPVLAGQYRSYIAGQLRLFRQEEARGGARFLRLMETFSHRLSDDAIAAAAAYYASIPPGTRQ